MVIPRIYNDYWFGVMRDDMKVVERMLVHSYFYELDSMVMKAVGEIYIYCVVFVYGDSLTDYH